MPMSHDYNYDFEESYDFHVTYSVRSQNLETGL